MRKILLLAGFASLLACTAVKLSYNNLDWFVPWQVSKYVDLGAPQEALLERGVQALWRWHRRTQLELYARDLRALAENKLPLSPAQVEHYLHLTAEHMERAAREALPQLVKVTRAMNEAQVAEMLESLGEKRDTRAEEQAELTVPEQQEAAVKKMLKNSRRWLGPVSAAQKQRMQTWAASRKYAPVLWQAYQKKWTGAFAALLVTRQQPDYPEHLSKLFLEPSVRGDDAINAVQAHNRQVWTQLMSDLSASLSAAQRQHFQEELRGLINDLDELALQSP